MKDRHVMINIDGQDTFPIRLPRDRMAWLILPVDFGTADVERLSKWLQLIAEGSVEKDPRPLGLDTPSDESTGSTGETRGAAQSTAGESDHG